MAISYYGYTISPNQLETGDGFLICRNVPIARIGTQEYLGTEVDRPEEQMVTVIRPEEEVFSDAAIASFEGKPFTDDHPPVLLDADNAAAYAKGHVQNVRRGTGEWKDYLVADIHVHDAGTIQEIRDGKREISCGYRCEWEENPDGTMTQRNIRGNHVALVSSGRAGARAAIMDSNTNSKADNPPERKSFMSKTNALLHLFGLAANGRSEEEVRRMADDTASVFDTDTAPEHESEGKPVPEEDAKDEAPAAAPAIDADALAKAIADAVIAALKPQAPEEEKPAEEDKDPLDEALETIGAEIKGEADEAPETAPAEEEPAPAPGAEDETSAEEEEAHVVPAEEMDEEKPAEDCGTMDAATAKALISAMRPSIAGITDATQRKAVTDALLGVVKRPGSAQDSDTAKIVQTAAKNAAQKASKSPTADIDAIQAAYDARNPHLAKKGD